MTPCEILGSNARYLDGQADTTPPGILGTPFGVVSDALRVVAASAWNVDPTVYRAGMAWAWYLGVRPAALAVDGFRALICAALVSECAPLVRESQTVGELVALLSLWMDYRPIFADMEALFATYGVRVDVRAISDPEGQALMPVDDTRLAFYIFVLSMDWQRPMLLGEIAETARRASPLGARPFVVYYVEGFVSVPVAPAPTDGFLWVDVWESAVEPIPPAPVLPTVSDQIWCSFTSRMQDLYKTVSADAVARVYNSSQAFDPFWYDVNLVYAIKRLYYRYSDTSGVEMPMVNDSGYLAAQNTTGSGIQVKGCYFVTCSDSTAAVVTVYNSSNVAYNAFKFTASGTDYYYVLDGTQTDWTDDLSSIGYTEDIPVTAYDIASGVISIVQLPTFNDGKYISTSFDSLRYYAKGTLSNTGMIRGAFSYPDNVSWYYGTITWNDPSLGDLSDKILTANPSGGQTELNTRQTIFRIIFITDGNITGWHPYDTDDAGVTASEITAYTYTNGIHSITFYIADHDWTSGAYAGRIQFRYLDGTTTFNSLNAFDLISVSNGTLSKETTTDRYDMYSVWGGNITIKAGSTAYTGYTRQDKQIASVSGNTWTKLFDENGNYIDYDSTKTYVITSYYASTTSSYGNNGNFVIGQSDGKLSVKYYRTGFSDSATWFTYTVS